MGIDAVQLPHTQGQIGIRGKGIIVLSENEDVTEKNSKVILDEGLLMGDRIRLIINTAPGAAAQRQ